MYCDKENREIGVIVQVEIFKGIIFIVCYDP